MNSVDILKDTFAGIADKTRALTGTSGVMTPAEMQTELDTFNTDISTVVGEQDDLIAQIIAALEKKMVPSDVVTSTTEVEEGSVSSYAEGTLYVVYEEA